MNFYKRYMGDYSRDTAHLSMLEHAAYMLLLDHYYSTELPLPGLEQCQRICRAVTPAEQEAVANIRKDYFPGGKNKRADEEIKKSKDYSDAQAMRAHMRWQSVGNAIHSHSHSHSQIPEPETKKELVEGSRKNGARYVIPDASPVVQTLPLRTGGEFEVRQSLVAELEPLYPAVDVLQTVGEMKGWLIGNPDRRKTRRGIRAFITRWLQSVQDQA